MQTGLQQQIAQVLADPLNLPPEFLNYLVQHVALNPISTSAVTTPVSVTQATSKTTAVTVNAAAGQITTHNASLAANTRANFVVSNATVLAGKTVAVSVASPSSGTNIYTADVIATSAQSFTISLLNLDTIAHTDTVVINFAVLKPSAS